jgi:DNA-binding FrmR family transcriptional regulator
MSLSTIVVCECAAAAPPGPAVRHHRPDHQRSPARRAGQPHRCRRRTTLTFRRRPNNDHIERSTVTEIVESQHGYISDTKRYLDRLKRIEGQARGIHRMVEEEQYCIDILTQIPALTSALQGVALGLLDDHLKHCVADAARLGESHSDAKISEASQAIGRLVRS